MWKTIKGMVVTSTPEAQGVEFVTPHSVPELLAQAYIRLNANVDATKEECLKLIGGEVFLSVLDSPLDMQYGKPIIRMDMLRCLTTVARRSLGNDHVWFYREQVVDMASIGKTIKVMFRRRGEFTSGFPLSGGGELSQAEQAKRHTLQQTGNAMTTPAYLAQVAQACITKFAGVDGLTVSPDETDPTYLVFNFEGAVKQATRQGVPK